MNVEKLIEIINVLIKEAGNVTIIINISKGKEFDEFVKKFNRYHISIHIPKMK